uniref:Uncharacterized protein n=1 Tax=Panagrolaimus sp. JU765 TaxID=591449 RepID=A0AC34Q0G4_9BILA
MDEIISLVSNLVIYVVYLFGWHIFNVFKILKRRFDGTNVVSLKKARVGRIIFRKKRDPEEIVRREDFWTILKRRFDGTNVVSLKKARVGRIIFRKKRDPEEIVRREDFWTVDDGFVDRNVLKTANWTVYSIDKAGVVLVELPKPLSEYTIEKYPFCYLPLFDEAMRTAQLDLASFTELADELEVDNKPPRTLFFTNTARCASTLFGSMLQHKDHSVVLGEHSTLMVMSIGFAENYWSAWEVERYLPALIKMHRKCVPSDKLFVFKGSSTEVKLVPFLSKLMPEIRHVFMFRKKGCDSVEKTVLRHPAQFFLAKMYNFSPFLTTSLFGFLVACEGPLNRELKPATPKEFAMLVYGGPYFYYKQNLDAFDLGVVWHHELIKDPENVLKPIFENLDLPLDLMADAKECLKKDSQENTFLSQTALAGIRVTEMTSELKASLVRYAERLQMEPEVSGLFE